ncbi:hypothetical protein HK099_001125 [Clydaea vesicula]|uniref:Cleavage stimulation factor 50 kDa subunit n=1 Tax=Clydaea vesicula TaxID=447962 RepID=A0AAD5U8U4_9FUNG|nr:hypothetical protein HK099_001125 [Clydaea vesicula]
MRNIYHVQVLNIRLIFYKSNRSYKYIIDFEFLFSLNSNILIIETLSVVNSCSECLSSIDGTHKFCYNCGNPFLLGDGTLLLDGTRSECYINLIVDLQNTDPKPEPEYVTWFNYATQGSLQNSFSPDGKFLATGSKDYSIKTFDITKIKECFLEKNDIKPVLKTIYDHQQPVNQIKFHPNGMVLASCADDGFIKFFDLVKPSSKKTSDIFNYNEDYVFGSDDSGFGVNLIVLQMFLAHQNVVGYVVASLVENAIISCSEDSSARFWMGEN